MVLLAGLLVRSGISQINTYSPYSRYGIGEMASTTFAHNMGMGGTHIALRPDSTMPVFLNPGNPASYPFIRLTTLEVGGVFQYASFRGNNNSSLRKWGTSFGYAAVGFPVRSNGGACFGLMPLSHVGYETSHRVSEANIGNVDYNFDGDGGLNKAFLGYGMLPFKRRLVRFRSRNLYLPDSLRTLSHGQYLRREKLNKLVNDFSLGLNANYIFGSIANITRVEYPNSLLYNNTYRQRQLTMGAFTGNFGAQTATTIDSITDYKGRKRRIRDAVTAVRQSGTWSEADLRFKEDSIRAVTPLRNRALKERVKFTFGYFMNLNNPMNVNYNGLVYNYILSGSGQEVVRDTVLFINEQKGTLRLPLEQGFGLGFKKGERINIVTDFAITDWGRFQYLNEPNDFRGSYRISAGANYVPEKYAAGRGASLRRVNYRMGASYQTGYLHIKDSYISDYSVSLGIGLPVGVGRLSSMVNITAQYGRIGSADPSLISQNYWRVHFGFTFCDRWFQKFRYD